MPKPKRDHIEKPEDKERKKWFDHLSPKEHEEYLSKLGLDEEDKQAIQEIKELEQHPLEEREIPEHKMKKKK